MNKNAKNNVNTISYDKYIGEFTDDDIYYFHTGKTNRAFRFMGSHFLRYKGVYGVVFRVYAPNATSVSVVGDFNNWDNTLHPMKKVTDGGIYQIFIAGLKEYDNYKYFIKNRNRSFLKSDPYAFHSETQGKTASKIYNIDGYVWQDDEFIKNRKSPYSAPINIYEVNLASWRRKDNNEYLTYVELADRLVSYVKEMGYTHIELMPLSEYPFDGSWGYQVTGYYSITSRFGTPKDFMYFVDVCHQNGIGVILDWVPAHFPKDEHGLYQFDGTSCYEGSKFGRIEHKTWGTQMFDWEKPEVKSFLISNAVFLFEKFHVDGLRVDAVASMLYLDYDRKDGEWEKNEFGGNYNLQAIDFLKQLNQTIFANFNNVLMIAEESTAFPMVTKPTYMGGLGFNFKWNMGWMNDTLYYMQQDPYFRSGNHNKMTFSMYYAFSENFILPISHDEVVHGKKSLLDKMVGDIDQKFANLRAYNMYMFAHPGKKLNFMGNEYGQFKEWDYKEGLEFFLLKFERHKKLLAFNKALNFVYSAYSPFYEIEDSWEGFSWITADEKDNNIIAFERKDKRGNILVAVINFSGNNYNKYRLGVEKGEYSVLLNSDDRKFDGSGKMAKRQYKSAKRVAHNRENSIMFDISKFSAIYFYKIK